MPNANTHRLVAGLSVTVVAATAGKKDEGDHEVHPIVTGCFATLCGTLPDIIEPATSPNHRQFFHSWCAVGAVCYGLHRAWKWQPESDFQKLMKALAIGAGGAYLVHLLMDARTPRGLPAF